MSKQWAPKPKQSSECNICFTVRKFSWLDIAEKHHTEFTKHNNPSCEHLMYIALFSYYGAFE